MQTEHIPVLKAKGDVLQWGAAPVSFLSLPGALRARPASGLPPAASTVIPHKETP